LKTKFAAHSFVDNQMVELENEAAQYKSPNEGSENVGSLDLYESPSPLNLCALRGNEHQVPMTQIMFWNIQYMIIRN
jgi:hypothetical protein